MAAFTTIDDAGLYFNTILWTGNSPSTQALTGVGFAPDMAWVKKRSSAAAHCVTDTVRGVTETIFPNTTTDETTRAGGLTVFGSDGYTVGADGDFNGGSATFVGWNWIAGTTSGLTGGSITPSAYSFNTTSGFGIYKYTGTGANATITHGLGVAPDLLISKNLSSSSNWPVLHTSYVTGAGALDEQTGFSGSFSDYWNAVPTSTLINIGTTGGANASGDEIVLYAFASIQGYSKFGSYDSNSSTDGPFVYTGFRPAWTLIKEASGSNPWVIDDVKREPINEMEKPLKPNNTDGTYSGSAYGIDLLSNGFKIRNNDSTYNGSSNTFIYAAFAEAPLVNSNGVPCNAR